MSYVRFSDKSDVYLYAGVEGVVCCGCLLDRHRILTEPDNAVAHLRAHQSAGHKVPEWVIATVVEDLRDEEEDGGCASV